MHFIAGSSTLSLLLDLPPSTPGGPLPRLSDLPGPTYERREQVSHTFHVNVVICDVLGFAAKRNFAVLKVLRRNAVYVNLHFYVIDATGETCESDEEGRKR